MKIQFPTTRKARIEMLPLIDIVFLLLVFFIYAMLSMAVHRGLPVLLPTSSSAKIDKDLVLSVTIQADGRIFLDKVPVPLEGLAQELMQKQKPGTDSGVMLFADRNLPYKTIFDVLDRIQSAGIHRVSLQADRERP